MVSQPIPTGRTYLGTKDSSGWRESSHPSHSQPSEGREGQEHWAQSESESDCTWLPSCKRNLGSSFSCYHGLTQWALASPTSAVSWGDHSWKLPRTAWAFRVFQQGAGSTTCLVPAGPWLGMIQSLLKLQLYSKVAWTPQPMGITGLDTSIHGDHRPGHLQPTGIPSLHIPGLQWSWITSLSALPKFTLDVK